MSLLGTMLVFLWAQENGRATSSAGDPGQEVLRSREELGEGVDSLGSARDVVKVPNSSEQSNPTVLISIAS